MNFVTRQAFLYDNLTLDWIRFQKSSKLYLFVYKQDRTFIQSSKIEELLDYRHMKIEKFDWSISKQ